MSVCTDDVQAYALKLWENGLPREVLEKQRQLEKL
jgi:hypothetical protein